MTATNASAGMPSSARAFALTSSASADRGAASTERAQSAFAVLVDEVGQGAEAAHADAVGGEVQRGAVCGERVGQLGDAAHGRDRGHAQHRRRAESLVDASNR